MTKDLKLVLKKKPYDMIESSQKLDEYRDLKPYYARRLFACPANIDWCLIDGATCKGCSNTRRIKSRYKTVTFYWGYAKNRPSMTFKVDGIKVGTGKPEWGAEPGKEYYVIKLGNRIK